MSTVRWGKVTALALGICLGLAFAKWTGEYGEPLFVVKHVCNPLLPYTCDP